MARYNGPKARINRRLKAQVYEDSGSRRATDRRDNPPGMHTRPRRPSNYGLALAEKQKIKHYYGLGERQLRRYFGNVSHKKGNTGELLLMMCEGRFDNVLRRAGVAKTRPQARQGISGLRVEVYSWTGQNSDTTAIQGHTQTIDYTATGFSIGVFVFF